MADIGAHGASGPNNATEAVAELLARTVGGGASAFSLEKIKPEALNSGVVPGVARLPFDEDMVLLLAIAANCALILAPLRSALRAARLDLAPKELVGLLTPTFLLFGQSYFWAVYGARTMQPDIWHFNAFGALMCLIYLGFICRGAKEQERIQIHVSIALGAAVVFSLLVAVVLPIPKFARVGLLAFIATGFSMLQSAAPMLQAMEVVQTHSIQNFPLGVSFFSMLSSLMWAQYAFMARDYLYLIPNALNATVGLIELSMVLRVVHQLASNINQAEKIHRQDLAGLPLKGILARFLQAPGGRLHGLFATWLTILFSANSNDFNNARYSQCGTGEPEIEPWSCGEELGDDCYL